MVIKGFCSSPVGVNHRLGRSLTAIKTRALQLRGSFAVLGRSVFHDWLQCGSSQRERRSLEVHHERCLNRSHTGSKKQTSGHGWVSCDGWHSLSFNWRSWCLLDKICLCPISQLSSICWRPLAVAFSPVTTLTFWRLWTISIGLLSQDFFNGMRKGFQTVFQTTGGTTMAKQTMRRHLASSSI